MSGTLLPHLDICYPDWVYDVAEYPVAIVAYVLPIVLFEGEGTAKVRPFFIFIFWLVVLIASLAARVRRVPQEHENKAPGAS